MGEEGVGLMRIETNHESTVPSQYIVFQPGDGTRYALHITLDYHGGWLVVWRDARAVFWVSENLEEIKQLARSDERNKYNEDMVLQCLNAIPWGPYYDSSKHSARGGV